MAETVGATNTRIFLWKFVADTANSVKNINTLHRVAQALAVQTTAATKKAQTAQSQMGQSAVNSGKLAARSLAVTGVSIGAAVTLWYSLRRILSGVMADTDRLTRILVMSGEGYKAAGTSAYRLLDLYTKIGGVALPEMIDATEELVAAGVRGEATIAGMAETSVKLAYALGLPAKEVARTFGSLQAGLGLSKAQMDKMASSMVVLVREGKATASMLLQVAQNTMFATKVTGIATENFMAMAASMEKAGLTAADAAGATVEWANMLSEDFGAAAMPFVDVGAYFELYEQGVEGALKATQLLADSWLQMGKTDKDRVQMARVYGMTQKQAVGFEAALVKNLKETLKTQRLALEAKERDKALNEAFADSMSNLSGAMTAIVNNLKSVAIAAGVILMPVLTALLWPLRLITDIFAALPNWLKAPLGALGMVAIGFVGLVFAMGQLVRVLNLLKIGWAQGTVAMAKYLSLEKLGLVATKLHTAWMIIFNKQKRIAYLDQLRQNAVDLVHLTIGRLRNAVLLVYTALTTGQTAVIQANTGATLFNTVAKKAGTLVEWGFTAAKAVGTAVMWLYNTAVGVSTGLLGGFAVIGGIVAGVLGFQTVAFSLLTVATWAFNAALYANPIVWIIMAAVAVVALLVGGFMLLYKYWDVVFGFIMVGVNAIIGVFKWLWDLVVSGAKWAANNILLLLGPIGWIIKAVGWLKKKMFGSGFLHIDEGVSSAVKSLRHLSNAYGAVGSAAENAYNRASGEVTVGTTSVEGARMVGRIGAGAGAGAGAGGAPAAAVSAGGVPVREIKIPITLVLDGRVIAETIVKVGKDQLLRMHSLPRRTMRGVPALG